jgi:glyceraldehyde 3-phosphate dehydrogenase
MKTRIAINGFGRIGRLVVRAMIEKDFLNDQIELVAVNDLVSAENLAYLLKYDSIHRRLKYDVIAVGENRIQIKNGDAVISDFEVLSLKVHPSELPWAERNIDIVIESTGIFENGEDANGHLKAGAKKVIISAPSDETTPTYLVGVNAENYKGENLISNASCTTNCLAPLIQVLLKEGVGIEEGIMTTNHAYTASQSLVDAPAKSDFKRGRAAATNIVPSSTGSAKAINLIFPGLKGRLASVAYRVPVADVSVVDLVFKPSRSTSMEEINKLMKNASETYLKGILSYSSDPVVSSDFVGDPHSTIYDANASFELNSKFFKLVAWYDNEWGYSNRIVDLVEKIR